MPLYVFLKSPQAHSKEAKEHQVNAMLTFSLPLDKQGKWILQNRNTYLHRFIVGGEDFDFYRGVLVSYTERKFLINLSISLLMMKFSLT